MLFLDVENFTALAESLDPEEVRGILSRYFEIARGVVARYGGTLEKFIGDAVMATWGAPRAHEDDAERAVRAALELLQSVERMGGAAAGRGIRARAAITSGEAAVTVGAEGQGLVAGDLVNTAARLQSSAPTGHVLVDESTRHLTATAFTFEPLGSRILKGKRQPVAAWCVIGPVVPQTAPAAAHSGPFVGRHDQLREVTELYRAVVRDQRSRLVSVIGIAGIGKSRLAWELERYLDGLDEQIAWHVARARSFGDGITFAPVADMVRRRARIAEHQDAALTRRQLAAYLGELVRDDEQRAWLEPRLAVLLDPELGEDFERDELFAAWRRFFEAVSIQQPAVVVFEDLQWADTSLLDFIEHLARWSRDHPILVVTLARPELLDVRPGWGSAQQAFTSMQLNRLTDGDIGQLLDGLVPGLPPATRARILERAGGVPLYAVEMARMIGDRRAEREDSSAVFADVPDSLGALIAARIDALPAGDRALLLPAAVLGRRFHPDALAFITRNNAAMVRRGLERLAHRGLLELDDELPSPTRGELTWPQDLVREVAYQTLSRSERRTLHLAAADYLEARPGEDVAETRAAHLLAAYRLGGNEQQDPLALRVRAALRDAAHRARALHAPERTLSHLQAAESLTTDQGELAALREEAAAAAQSAARFALAEGYLRQQVTWYERSGQQSAAARSRAQLASLLLTTQRNESALRELEKAARAIGDVGSDPAGAEVAAQIARARAIVGDNDEALTWADRALDAAQRLDLPAVATDVRVTRGTALFRLGDTGAGLRDLRLAIRSATRRGYLSTELRARNNLAWLLVTDDPRATLVAARAGMETALRMGVGDMALQLADVAGQAAVETGDWDWALATLDTFDKDEIAEAHRIDFAVTRAIILGLRGQEPSLDGVGARDSMDPQLRAGIDLAFAWGAFAGGRFADAVELARRAAGSALGAEQHSALVLAARASVWSRDLEGVRQTATALEALPVSGRAILASRHTIRAALAALEGVSAEQQYRAAVERWRRLRLPLQLALCLAERAYFGRRHRKQDAREAMRILDSLGASALRRMTEQWLSSPMSSPSPSPITTG